MSLLYKLFLNESKICFAVLGVFEVANSGDD